MWSCPVLSLERIQAIDLILFLYEQLDPSIKGTGRTTILLDR
jgi:hypothetical protein